MATNFLMSPGVLIKEQDLSSYVVTTAATKVAMVGYTAKGPVDSPVLCISAQDFINKFGEPPEDNPYMALAALKYFEEGSSVLINRVGYTLRDARELSAWVTGNEVEGDEVFDGIVQKATLSLSKGEQTAAVPVITGTKDFSGGLTYETSVDFTLKYYNADDLTNGPSYTATISGDIGGAGVQDVAAVVGALNDLRSSTGDNPALDWFLFAVNGSYIDITMIDETAEFKDTNATLTITGTGGDTTISQLGYLEGNRTAYGVGVVGADIDPMAANVAAKTEGTWGNNITLRFYSEAVSTYDADAGGFIVKPVYKAEVYYEGRLVENFPDIDWTDATAPNYVETLFTTAYGEGSDYISIEFEDSTSRVAPTDIGEDDDYLVLEDGANGIPVVEGSMTADWADGLNNSVHIELGRGVTTLNNSENYEFDVVLAPAQSSSVVVNALISLVNARRDTMALIDPPFGLNHEDVTDWHNGEGSGNTAAFNTSYAALYWPWLHDYDPYNKQYIWLPPSGYVAKQYVYTDNISDPWQAPAGMTRGKITALDVEQSASQPQRDLLYGEMNAVNPIVNFVGEGITIWGQKTLLRDTKATNRVNVRRLLIFAERLMAKMAKSFIFEPTDETTWADFTRRANTILEPIRIRRGLYTYKVVMDSSTNTPAVINQNKMVGNIFLQPTKTAEFIEVTFTITAAGDTFIGE